MTPAVPPPPPPTWLDWWDYADDYDRDPLVPFDDESEETDE